jgi:HAMP domain-containing protein
VNDDEIAAIRARLKTISTPPWSVISGEHGEWYIYGADGFAIHDSFNSTADGLAIAAANRALIEHAPVDIAYLLDEVEELQTEAARLRQSIERLRIENERLENELRTARAEATSVRPGQCVPGAVTGEGR